MGKALEVVVGRALNPGATITAMTPGTGNTFTVRNFDSPGNAVIDDLWAEGATAGVIRVRSPKFHDFVQGIRYTYIAGVSRGLLPDELMQPITAQDLLTFEISGGGAETDLGAFLAYYTDVPGLDARLADWTQVAPRIVNVLTNEVAVVNPTTAGDWSGGTAINTTLDLLKANTDYAILGYQCATAVGAVGISGSDTANLRLGGPGTTEAIETRDWFLSMNKATGRPYVPIINSANKGGTLVSVAHTTAGGTTTVDLILAQLTPGA
jgi:hypothetical protein